MPYLAQIWALIAGSLMIIFLTFTTIAITGAPAASC